MLIDQRLKALKLNESKKVTQLKLLFEFPILLMRQ